MNNQLIGGNIILGGFCYEVALPFSKARKMSFEKVLARTGKGLNKETLGVASKILDKKGYSHYLKAIEVAEKRFLFYKDILEFKDLRDRYLKVLDSEDLTLRIVFAMHGCIAHTNKILCYLDNLISDTISEAILTVGMGYTIVNIEEPIADCLMTGVCVCKQRDIAPYIDSCVMSDPTKIIISKRENDKRFADVIDNIKHSSCI